MISHERFGELRLANFLPDTEIAPLENWEFMDHNWVGEAVGLSEWLRLEKTPDVLRSLTIDFSEFPEQAASEVLRTIELPVRRGMNLDQLSKVLGNPAKEKRFVNDRVSYEFVVPGSSPYTVSCTVLNEDGLIYLVVMAPLPRRRG